MPWETLTTSRGRTYTDWSEPLPRIHDLILSSIVYLYPDTTAADIGMEAGGSGFLISMGSDATSRVMKK